MQAKDTVLFGLSGLSGLRLVALAACVAALASCPSLEVKRGESRGYELDEYGEPVGGPGIDIYRKQEPKPEDEPPEEDPDDPA